MFHVTLKKKIKNFLCVAAPWGKRSWKTFYAVLKGMVLYLQKVRGFFLWKCEFIKSYILSQRFSQHVRLTSMEPYYIKASIKNDLILCVLCGFPLGSLVSPPPYHCCVNIILRTPSRSLFLALVNVLDRFQSFGFRLLPSFLDPLCIIAPMVVLWSNYCIYLYSVFKSKQQLLFQVKYAYQR